MPRLSVIMPMRNAAATVESAVRSTLRALPSDAELVIYDDASEDRSLYVVDSISDSRVRLIEGAGPVGVSAALTHMLDTVDCQWVGRMDADDICLPWRFRAQLPALRRCDVSFGQVVNVRDHVTSARPLPPLGISAEALPLHLVLSNPLGHPTMVGGLEAIRRIGGYRGVATEDYDLWLRLAASGSRLTRIGVPVLLYRIHAGQVTASSAWRARPFEPALRESYESLCLQVLGQLPTWLPTPRRNAQPRQALEQMIKSVARAADKLPSWERVFLMHKLRSSLKYAVDP